MKKTLKKDCLTIFEAGVKAVNPYQAVKHYLKGEGDFLYLPSHTVNLSAFKNIYVLGAGKASAYMALALEKILGERLKGGLIIVKYGHGADLKKVKIIEAGHPIPDENGLCGARALVDARSSICQRGSCLLCYLRRGFRTPSFASWGDKSKRKTGDYQSSLKLRRPYS